jgi:predicted acylesterase/phospholipase RssA
VDEKAVAWQLRTTRRQLVSMAINHRRLLRWASLWISDWDLQKADTPDTEEKIQKQQREKPYYDLVKDIHVKSSIKTLMILTPKTQTNRIAPTVSELKREGKVGLALSGGGFRAALFHIGVLASLAERDLLKNIEVISCVSGGSIIGAYYYLHLKNLLEKKQDHEITRKDYIDLVKTIEKNFLIGVQKNLRMRVLTNWGCNMRMIFSKDYSRTHRLGELYEKHLFTTIERYTDKKEIYMQDLFIKPANQKDFSIAVDNNGRMNKVPQLILNATSVNTGHNWQFTASWMGEPPGSPA